MRKTFDRQLLIPKLKEGDWVQIVIPGEPYTPVIQVISVDAEPDSRPVYQGFFYNRTTGRFDSTAFHQEQVTLVQQTPDLFTEEA